MKLSHKIELLLIVGLTAFTAVGARWLPGRISLGELALIASALLLAQGLVRDLWIKYGRKTNAESCAIGDSPQATCMCMESSLGIFGILAGTSALLAGVDILLQLEWYFWPLLVLFVCLIGYSLKSVVIDWKAKRLRLVRDHRTVKFGSRT